MAICAKTQLSSNTEPTEPVIPYEEAPEIRVRSFLSTKERPCKAAFATAEGRLKWILADHGIFGEKLELRIKQLDAAFSKMTLAIGKHLERNAHVKENRFATSCGWLYTSVDNVGFKIIAISKSCNKLEPKGLDDLPANDRKFAEKWISHETELRENLDRICRLITIALQAGIGKKSVIKSLSGIKCISITFYNGFLLFSCLDIISKVMSEIPAPPSESGKGGRRLPINPLRR